MQENAQQLVQICFDNVYNRHLRSQSLNGFYQLFGYDKLVDDTLQITMHNHAANDANTSNLELIAKTLWHSLMSISSEHVEECDVRNAQFQEEM